MKAFDKNLPLVEMDKEQLQATFDAIGMDTNISMLNDTRKGVQDPIIIATALLCLADGTERIAYAVLEYGDDDGFSQIENFIAECERCALLKRGESIRLAIYEPNGLVEITRPKRTWPRKAK